MDSEVLKIFNSTIALSMASIFALGGIFAIYRLQEINNEITRTCNAFKESWRRLILYREEAKEAREKDSQEVNEWLNKDVFHKLIWLAKDRTNVGLLDYFTQLNHQLNFRTKLQHDIWKHTSLITITFFVSIIDLLILDVYLGPIILLILTAWTIYEVLEYIRTVIDGPIEEHFNNDLTTDFKYLIDRRISQIKNEIESQICTEKNRIKENLEREIKNHND